MKKIKFGKLYPYIDVPAASRKYVPDWYKSGDKASFPEKSAKMCVPFLDAMISGYTAELWQDLYVAPGPVFDWKINLGHPMITTFPEAVNASMELPVPEGHFPTPFLWESPYEMLTPPGYSLLITHPVNRFDLPFTTFTGLQDSDVPLPIPQSIPFFIKEGFTGVIPAGTPIFQAIPIKRESWKSEENPDLVDLGKKSYFRAARVNNSWYRHEVWKKKSYE